MFPFCGYQLDGKLFFSSFLLPGKVYADVIDSLKYCLGKVQMKSEIYAKHGRAIYF